MLRRMKLIEGHHSHIIVCRKVAQAIDKEVEYTDLKGFEDDYYKDLIIKSLKEHERLRRDKIDRLIMDRLPSALNEKQKKNHIDYLLKSLRRIGAIHVGKDRCWEIGSEHVYLMSMM